MSNVISGLAIVVLWNLFGTAQASAGASVQGNVPSISEALQMREGPLKPIWTDVVTNRGSSTLIAFEATFSCSRDGVPNAKQIVVYDPLSNYSKDRAIPPGGKAEVSLAVDGAACPGGVNAAIFSDGHTEGNQEGLDVIAARRRGTYHAVLDCIDSFNKVAMGTANPIDTADLMHQRQVAKAHDSSVSTEERLGAMFVYTTAEILLRQPGNFRVPSDVTDHRQPVVEDLTRTSGLSKDRASATILREKLREWKTDLEAAGAQ